MSTAPETAPAAADCWNRIGTSGDRSCPELERHVHCRNCPVYESGARAFFDRPAPPGYLDEWARALDAGLERGDEADISVLVFRLGSEWLALPTAAVVEVTEPRPVHRIPHRSNAVLAGMVNLRGRLQLQVSLHGLLGSAPGEAGGAARLVVAGEGGSAWAFACDEVAGVRRVSRTRLSPVPATLADPAHAFSQAVIAWGDRSVGLLDERRVFAALRGLGR